MDWQKEARALLVIVVVLVVAAVAALAVRDEYHQFLAEQGYRIERAGDGTRTLERIEIEEAR